ncbi:hypothetical protein D9M71_768200 [compost metagenome]
MIMSEMLASYDPQADAAVRAQDPELFAALDADRQVWVTRLFASHDRDHIEAWRVAHEAIAKARTD